MAKDYKVYPKGGKWVAKAQDATRASSLHETQKQAYEAAHRYVTNAGGGDISIHRKDTGAIREKNTIAKKDPFPPRG